MAFSSISPLLTERLDLSGESVWYLVHNLGRRFILAIWRFWGFLLLLLFCFVVFFFLLLGPLKERDFNIFLSWYVVLFEELGSGGARFHFKIAKNGVG